MKDKVKSKEAYQRESRIIKFEREEWYMTMLKHTLDKSINTKDKVILNIYAGYALGHSTRFGGGQPTEKIVQTKNIQDNVTNLCLVSVASKSFDNDTEANRYLESVVKPAIEKSGIQKYLKYAIEGMSRIRIEIDVYSDASDISCYPLNYKGKDVKKKFVELIKTAFYFDLINCKKLKEPEAKKLPTIKPISSEEFQKKFLALCKKVDKGFGVKMLNLGEISDNAFKKAISDLPYDYLSAKSYSMDFESIRRDIAGETSIDKIFTIDSEKGERNSFIRGEIRFWRTNKNYGVIQSTDITLSFKVATYNYTPFIPEEAFKYVEYYMKNEILKNIKLEPLES
jgi:hypothetical protein